MFDTQVHTDTLDIHGRGYVSLLCFLPVALADCCESIGPVEKLVCPSCLGVVVSGLAAAGVATRGTRNKNDHVTLLRGSLFHLPPLAGDTTGPAVEPL